jgi:anaerobic magnesium-protoporphyrin IX monomethyl ester cyclase
MVAGEEFMRVLLVNSVSYYVKQKAAIPLGLLSLATYLTNNGYTVQIYDRTVDGGSLKKRMNSFLPDIVGVSSLGIKSFDDAMKVSKAVKKRGVPVVWGGHIPSLIPELVLKSGLVDYVVIGDGEITFLALLQALVEKSPLRAVEGLAFFENGEAVINKEREDADLSQLPVINFSYIKPEKYFLSNMGCKKMTHIYSSRGCTGHCTYCYSPGYSKCRWRARPAEYCISELRTLVEHCGIDGFYFVDDLFSPNKERVNEMCDKLIQSGLGLLWSCDMRTDICTEEILRKMYNAGCRWIFFGIESGSGERQKAIKKRLETEKIKETIEFCNQIGIWTTTSFVIGFPDETEEELKQTLELVRQVKSNVKLAAMYGPMPKSEMYGELIAKSRLAPPQSYNEWKSLAIIDTIGNSFSKVPALELKVIANYFFFSIFMPRKTNENKKNASGVWVRRLFELGADILKRANMKSVFILFLSAAEFLQIIYYALMYPKIRHKYGLYFLEENRRK